MNFRSSGLGTVFFVFIMVFAWTPHCFSQAEGCLELSGRWAHGPTLAVAHQGDHVFFGRGPTLSKASASLMSATRQRPSRPGSSQPWEISSTSWCQGISPT